jgi:hypothetical protein
LLKELQAVKKALDVAHAGQHDQNAKVPGIVAVDALFLGVVHADPKSNQHA